MHHSHKRLDEYKNHKDFRLLNSLFFVYIVYILTCGCLCVIGSVQYWKWGLENITMWEGVQVVSKYEQFYRVQDSIERLYNLSQLALELSIQTKPFP